MIERKSFPVAWKVDEHDDGSLVGYASTFGNVDHGGDVVMPGAFTRSVARIKTKGIPLLADHEAMTSALVGTIYDAGEDASGLWIRARLAGTQRAQDIRSLLLDGHLDSLSIGYEVMDDAYEDRNGQKVRLLREVKLWEVSVVVFPMNPEATIAGVKRFAPPSVRTHFDDAAAALAAAVLDVVD